MKVGVFVHLTDLERGPVALADVLARIEHAEACGLDSAFVMDHVFLESRPGRRATAHDPFVALAAAASRTTRIELGTLVVCAPLRLPVQVARETAGLQELSGGRFTLGLGAGWHRPEFDAHGIAFDHLVSRFEATVEAVFGPLAAGEGVVPMEPRARLLMGAGGPRTRRFAARRADAWNAVWFGSDPAPFAERLALFRTALAEAGRPQADVEITAGLLAVLGDARTVAAERERVRPLGGMPGFITGDGAAIAESLAGFREAGADHLIVALGASPALDGPAPLEAIDRLAEAVVLAR